MADIQSAAAEIRRGKKERRKRRNEERNHRAKYNCLSYSILRQWSALFHRAATTRHRANTMHSLTFRVRTILHILRFRATVCKTVSPMLSDCCPVCPVLSVTLVNCGQTVGRIKMKLGGHIGLDPGHTVSDGDPAPLPKGAQPSPQFSAHSCCGQMAAWIKIVLGAEV